jgi:hypothetical protein
MLELYLEQDEVDSSTFKKVLDSFYDFVEDITANVAGKKGAVKWSVKVKEGSVRFLNYPYADLEYANTIPEVYAYIKQGINTLGDKAVRPEKYTDSILEKLQKLALLKKEGISYKIKMDNEEVRISSDSLIANINEVLGCKYEAYGSLEGKLQTISSRAGLNFILYEALTDKPVRCTLKDDLLTTALKSFNKRIYVFGNLKYNSNNDPVSISVQELHVFLDDEDIPTFGEMKGILKDTL